MALETTATFIGHNECFGLSAEKLKNAIRELIEKGVTDFLSGGQGGFDGYAVAASMNSKRSFRTSITISLFLISLSMFMIKSFSIR